MKSLFLVFLVCLATAEPLINEIYYGASGSSFVELYTTTNLSAVNFTLAVDSCETDITVTTVDFYVLMVNNSCFGENDTTITLSNDTAQIDTQLFTAANLSADMGRYPDGDANFYVIDNPTPEAANMRDCPNANTCDLNCMECGWKDMCVDQTAPTACDVWSGYYYNDEGVGNACCPPIGPTLVFPSGFSIAGIPNRWTLVVDVDSSSILCMGADQFGMNFTYNAQDDWLEGEIDYEGTEITAEGEFMNFQSGELTIAIPAMLSDCVLMEHPCANPANGSTCPDVWGTSSSSTGGSSSSSGDFRSSSSSSSSSDASTLSATAAFIVLGIAVIANHVW